MLKRTAVVALGVVGSLSLAGACSSSDSTVSPGSTAGAGGIGGSRPNASAGTAGQAVSGSGGVSAAGGASQGGGGGVSAAGGASPGGSAGSSGNVGSSGNAGSAGDTQTGAGMAGQAGAAGASCIDFSVQATRSSAALLLVLDASGSMTTQSKWAALQVAVVNALDQNGFDGVTLGASRYPTGYTDPPACLCNQVCTCSGATCSSTLGIPGLACDAGPPSVALAAAGTNKSAAASGVRHSIYQFLSATTPLSSTDDGSPAYGALSAGIAALKQATAENRVLVWITDGSPNCASVANPTRPGYADGNGCTDWEEPSVLSALVGGAEADATTPVRTFVIGLPGSDSTGAVSGAFSTAPYSMALALSTIAVAGAPELVHPSCDSSQVFSKSGPAPARPCHLNLADGLFSNAVLATAISTVGAQALDCVFNLPQAPAGKAIDPAATNIVVDVGGAPTIIPKRSAATDACTDGLGCWDTLGASELVLRGAACPALANAATLSVELQVGCPTVFR